MGRITKSIFFPPKDKALARKISIRTPNAFRKSIKILKKQGLNLKEKKALVLARTRARVQLARKNLSLRERKQFEVISRMRIPKVTGKKKR
ncbi:hypothetical protein LCGC14_1811250 [marine sediment metagenome]|uniref:Uncharacterized protein n=1 Tax=marine sediment metagenome TaxID=412755 RepID=A0A0F9JLG9_9ZZZZ